MKPLWYRYDNLQHVITSPHVSNAKLLYVVGVLHALVCKVQNLFLPAGGAGGAATGGDHIFSLGNMKTSQVQEVSDHLTFNGKIQCCVGMEAGPETQQLENVVWKQVCLNIKMCVCVYYLGDILTSRIQGLRFLSSMISKPNSSWQL